MTQASAMSNAKPEKASRQIRHLALYAIVEEGGLSALSRAVVVTLTGLLLALIVWASVVHIDEVAQTYGSVAPSSSVQVVQHLEGGIVRDILVEDRALVEKDQVLLRMDPVASEAELDQAESRRASLMVREERIHAFVDGRKPDFSKIPDKYRGLIEDQTDILNTDTDRRNSQQAVLAEQIQQKREEIAAVLQQQKSDQEQLKLLSEEEAIREEAYKGGVSSRVNFFAVRRQRAAMESELSRLQGQEMTARKSLLELQKRQADLDVNLRQDNFKDLGAVTAELAQLDDSINRLRDRVQRLEIRSPVKGFVQNLKARTVGAVVPAGGVVMEIVPMEDDLQVETKISPRDVGHLHEGQKVVVKVASYDFVRYGSIPGTLKQISATTYLDDQDKTPYYKGWVTLERPWVGTRPNDNVVLPGMTVQADIITGSKTLLQYLLKPIQVSLAQAFHER